MPGYKVATVEPVKGDVVCPHCELMLRNAVQTEEGFRLCKTCFEEICLEPDHTCPRCCISVNPKQFWPDKAVQRDILETLVQCDFHTLGCPWQGQLKHLEEHNQGCRYQPVRCPNHTYGCSELLAPDEMDKHIYQECQFRRVRCSHCHLECLAAGLEEHLTTCPKYPVICDRCSHSVSRDQHEEHQLDGCAVVECQIYYRKQAPSLKELVNLPVAAYWYDLGIQLGVPTDKLKEFRVNHPHQAQSCLDDMFDWWLKNGEKPTHSQLAEALSDIGRRDLTMKIRSQEGYILRSGAKNSSSQNKKAFPEGEKKSGFRKLWGAVKSCTTRFVEGFLDGLGSLADGLGIRRRYKKYNDVERWWFELKADEKDLQALERSKEWKKLQAETGWRLGACFMASP